MDKLPQKSVTVRIHNPAVVAQMAQRLQAVEDEMDAINVRNTPIKWQTKARWTEEVRAVRAFLQKFLPAAEDAA